MNITDQQTRFKSSTKIHASTVTKLGKVMETATFEVSAEVTFCEDLLLYLLKTELIYQLAKWDPYSKYCREDTNEKI